MNKIARINTRVIYKFHETFGSKWFTFIVFALFASQALFYALAMAPFTPPDEIWHYTFVQEIASNPLYPFGYNTDLLVLYGLDFTGGLEYLYHFLLAVPTVFTRLFMDENIYFLRVINIFIVGVGLYYMRRLAIELIGSKAYANFLVLIFSSAMMFGALSASVNYDNAIFTLASASSYLLYLHIRKPTLKRLIIISSLSCAILVSKSAAVIFVLPVIAIALFSFVAGTRKRGMFKVVKREFKKLLRARLGKVILLTAAILVLLALESYGGNLLRYGHFRGSCVDRYNLETCENYSWFYKRAQSYKNSGKVYDGDESKFLNYWSDSMFKGVYGFVGHGRIRHHDMVEPVFGLILIIALIGFIRKADAKNLKMLLPFILISGIYFTTLLFFNYTTYKSYGGVLVAVQGRYLFPVLPLIFIIMLYYIKALFGKAMEIVTISIVVTLSLASFYAGIAWFRHQTSNSNASEIINADLWEVLYKIQ